jgi:hypothetical protein
MLLVLERCDLYWRYTINQVTLPLFSFMPTVCRFVSSNLEFKEEPAEEATRGIGNKVRVL